MFLLHMHFAEKCLLLHPTSEINSNITYDYQSCLNQNMLSVTFKNLTFGNLFSQLLKYFLVSWCPSIDHLDKLSAIWLVPQEQCTRFIIALFLAETKQISHM